MKSFSKIIGMLLLGLMMGMCGEKKVETENAIEKPKILKEITSYSESPYSKPGYEDITESTLIYRTIQLAFQMK